MILFGGFKIKKSDYKARTILHQGINIILRTYLTENLRNFENISFEKYLKRYFLQKVILHIIHSREAEYIISHFRFLFVKIMY